MPPAPLKRGGRGSGSVLTQGNASTLPVEHKWRIEYKTQVFLYMQNTSGASAIPS